MLKKQYKIFFGGIWYYFFVYQTCVCVLCIFSEKSHTYINCCYISRCIYIKSHVELMWKSLRINSFLSNIFLSLVVASYEAQNLFYGHCSLFSHYFSRSETELMLWEHSKGLHLCHLLIKTIIYLWSRQLVGSGASSIIGFSNGIIIQSMWEERSIPGEIYDK